MNFLFLLYLFCLFVLLVPGIIVTLPRSGKQYQVAIVHGLLFTAIYYITYKIVLKSTNKLNESFETFTRSECEDEMGGIWHANSECTSRSEKRISFLSDKQNVMDTIQAISTPGQFTGGKSIYNALR